MLSTAAGLRERRVWISLDPSYYFCICSTIKRICVHICLFSVRIFSQYNVSLACCSHTHLHLDTRTRTQTQTHALCHARTYHECTCICVLWNSCVFLPHDPRGSAAFPPVDPRICDVVQGPSMSQQITCKYHN